MLITAIKIYFQYGKKYLISLLKTFKFSLVNDYINFISKTTIFLSTKHIFEIDIINLFSSKEVSLKIDIVYTYVDGNDQNWLQKKSFAEDSTNIIEHNANDSARYMDNEELKYSLRSIEKYAPWINNIFILTDNQTPAWLNIGNTKIKVIDHKDIFYDKSSLPCFNAKAIETQIHHIENLSERFIYFNDDMFLGRLSCPEDFFDKDGKPNIFVSEFFPFPSKKAFDFDKRVDSRKNDYQESVIRSRILYKNKFNKSIYYNIRHGVKPLLKSVLFKLEKALADDVKRTSSSKFRSGNDIMMFHLCQFYCLHKKLGNPIYLKSVVNTMAIKNIIASVSKNNFAFINLENNALDSFLRKLQLVKPFIYCLNQTPATPDSNLILMKNFLELYFPHKSKFEK